MTLHLFTIGFNLLAFIMGVYLIDKVIEITLKKILKDEAPTSIPVFKAGIFLGYGILFYFWQGSVQKASVILKATLSGYDLIISVLSYSALFWITSLIISIALLGLAYLILKLITGGRNMRLEIAQGNMGFTILFTSVFIALIIAMLPVIIQSYELCLPYPEVPMFR